MADSQQRQRVAGLQTQGAPAEDADGEDEIHSSRCLEMGREMRGHAEVPVASAAAATSSAPGDAAVLLAAAALVANSPAPQRWTPETGFVREFEQAMGNFQQVISPGAAGIPDKFTASSTLMDTSPSSPMLSASSAMSPIYPGAGHGLSPGVRVTSDDIGHLELVTEGNLQKLKAFVLDTMQEELTSFESRLHSGLEAFEKMGVQRAQDLERHVHDQRPLADRVDGLQRQFVDLEQRVAQELEQLGQASGKALDRIRNVGPRLDNIFQYHSESVEALEMADQEMAKKLQTLDEQMKFVLDSRKAQEEQESKMSDVCSQMQQFCQSVDTEMAKLEGMLHGPGPSVETDLQKIFQHIEHMQDIKENMSILNQIQLHDQNYFHEVDMFQRELCRRMNDEMAVLTCKVDGVTDMVQEDLMGLHSKLSSDIEHLQADREAAPMGVFGLASSSIGAAIVKEPPVQVARTSLYECRWDMQQRALETSTAINEAHPEGTEAEPGARTPPSEQLPEHDEQPPKVVCGDPPPLAGGHLTARLESRCVFHTTLPVEATGDSEPPPSPKPAALGLAVLQRTMDQKLDMSLGIVDGFITRHEAKLQQLAEVVLMMTTLVEFITPHEAKLQQLAGAGIQYSEVQQSVDGLRKELLKEIGTVRDNLDEFNTCNSLLGDHNLSF